ncbi:cell division protein FtsA [Aliicoccus persicus]|uniref:Cell division protein FtsA n=1 Tax=Aliicoccus persicus TaxID=930138 RepID=A0A662Z2G0_9STAP|nr:cell division protein FtsA [Aliicoccus persicus]SEV80646.1 cell division protein FtsA [Aliicoccus persicus]
MDKHYYVALDIGSSSVKAVVGEKFHEGVNIIGTGQTYTDGVIKGNISNFEAVRSAITDTVKKAKISSDVDLDEVFLKIPTTDSLLVFEENQLNFNGEPTEINGTHIEDLLENIREKINDPDHEVVNVFPIYFKVDNLHEVVDPKEMIATESLSIHAGAVLKNRSQLINIVKCVEDAGLEVLELFSDATNFEHILSESEIELGSVIIDVGHEITQYAYYERGSLRALGAVPYGGMAITSDLSEAFNTNYEQAERLKHQYGHAFYDHANDEDIIKIPQRDNSEDLEVTAKDLADIIELRLEETLTEVFKALEANKINRVSGGFVLTGGTVNLSGVKELVQDLVAEKVRIHIPNQMGARKPEFSSVISTISSAILFDELLDYVTIDNHEGIEETQEEQTHEEGNFFSNIFKMRREENDSRLGKKEPKKVESAPPSEREESSDPVDDTPSFIEPEKDVVTEDKEPVQESEPETFKQEDYGYDGNEFKTDDGEESQVETPHEPEEQHSGEEQKETKGEYFKKLFRNLFE